MCEAERGLSPEKILAEGKTKVVIATEDVAMVDLYLKDILTAGDGERKEVFEGIGSLKTTAICNIFSFLRLNGIRNHFIERRETNVFRALRCLRIPLEVVARRSAPPRSSYLKRNPKTKEGTVFEDLVIEFFLKDDDRHDPFVYTGGSEDEWLLFDPGKPVMEGQHIGSIHALLTGAELVEVRGIARLAFMLLENAFAAQGLVLHDFKVEFGRSMDVRRVPAIILADTLCLDEMRLTKNGKVLDKDVFRAGGDPREIMENYAYVAAVTEKFFEGAED